MDNDTFLQQGEEAMLNEHTEDYFNCLPCAEAGIIRGASTLDSAGSPVCENHQLPD